MDVYLIVVQDTEKVFRVLAAWDDDAIQGNPGGWQGAKTEAYADHGAENIRIVRTSIDWDAVACAFDIHEV